MSRKSTAALFAIAMATTMGGRLAHAISHTSDYRTNMNNYRTCTDPLLETCTYEEILSPSKFYLPHGTTTTVIHKDDGTVQLRIDAGGILTDTGISYPCGDRTYPCSAPTGVCVGGVHPGTGCTRNRCLGGSNDGASCAVDSQCPGATCTAGASCTSHVCLDGPRDGFSCGGGSDLACTNVANTSGWSVVFRGNQSSFQSNGDTTYTNKLVGDGDVGCMKACSFSLGSTGAINSSGLSCSLTSTCGLLDAFHYVEIRDPDGAILAIPTVGAATLPYDWLVEEGDPARTGDCSRPSNAAFCP